jgi:predicted phosphate transport protein (TIGR00153 family)
MGLTSIFGDTVVQSPIVTLREHMQVVTATVQSLAEFIDAAQGGDWELAATLQARIAGLDDEADHLKQQLRRELPKRLWMPVARSDLLDLMSAQDKLASQSKDIAGLMLGREMAFPSKLNKGLAEFVDLSLQAARGAEAAVEGTHTLFRSGFAEREAREVERLIAVVERIEQRSDKRQLKLRSRMYKLEKNLPPVDAVFLYQVLVWIGNIADRAEGVTHRLLLIVRS